MPTRIIAYGVLWGLLLSVMNFAPIPFSDKLNFAWWRKTGDALLIIGSLSAYFGIRSVREDVTGGYISFKLSVKIGLWITLVASTVCLFTWLIIFYQVSPDFPSAYGLDVINRMRSANKSDFEIRQAQELMMFYNGMLRHPMLNLLIIFIKPIPVGIVATLLSAANLFKKNPEIPEN
jgi:hypothetical protein